MSDYYVDRTDKVCCPFCRSSDQLGYNLIPKSRRVHWEGDEEYTEHFGPVRDYHCSNCDSFWIVEDEEARNAQPWTGAVDEG